MSDYFTKLGGGFQRRADRSERDRKLHAIFNLLGLLAGVAAAYLAWDLSRTIALPIFVFFAVNYFVGRGLGDVVTDPHKVQRFFYFVMPVVIDSGLVYLTYRWWELMWLSVLIGFVVGVAIWAPIATTVFGEIHKQESEDTQRRIQDSASGR